MLTTCSAGRHRLWIVKQRQAERTDRLATIFVGAQSYKNACTTSDCKQHTVAFP